jgi:hypothetical protein
MYAVDTLQKGFLLNKTLLKDSWCANPTGNYHSHPENVAPACECINNKYAGLVYDLTKTAIDNTTISDIYMEYLKNPWNNNSLALYISAALGQNTLVIPSVSVVTSTVQTTLPLQTTSVNQTTNGQTTTPPPYILINEPSTVLLNLWRAQNPTLLSNYTYIHDMLLRLSTQKSLTITSQTDKAYIDYWANDLRKCVMVRAFWEVGPYWFRLHPVILGFYLSYALFMLMFSYFFRVTVRTHMGAWARWYLFILTAFPVTYMMYVDIESNWPYAVALIFITFNYITAITDEFSSMDDYDNPKFNQYAVVDGKFSPPHPLLVGLWYFVLIEFPVIVTYLGFVNLTRDVMGLIGFYMIGYLIALAVQRICWTQWYQRPGMKLETYNMVWLTDNPSLIMSKAMGDAFRPLLTTILLVIFLYVYFLGAALVFMQWNNTTAHNGHWMAMTAGIIYIVYFMLCVFYQPRPSDRVGDKPLRFELTEASQLMCVLLATVLFVLGTVVDAFID